MSNKESAPAGKSIFSNPAHPDSAYQPEMKDISQVSAMESHVQAHGQAQTTTGRTAGAAPQVAVYGAAAPPDVVVTPDKPLIISGSGPVVADFGTVTIEPGGQIQVYTTATINIKTLIKK